MIHTRGRIFKVFGIILNSYCCYSWDILRLVALVLGAGRLLTMVKDTSGLCPIVVGEVFL
jgi:hypothetical protein